MIKTYKNDSNNDIVMFFCKDKAMVEYKDTFMRVFKYNDVTDEPSAEVKMYYCWRNIYGDYNAAIRRIHDEGYYFLTSETNDSIIIPYATGYIVYVNMFGWLQKYWVEYAD